MDFKRYVDLFLRWAWLIILGALVAGGIAFGVNKTITPTYRATATLLINQTSVWNLEADYYSVWTSQELAKTYQELIKKRPVLLEVVTQLNLDTTPERLVGELSVSAVRDTMLVNVSAEDENPQLAATIANQTAAVFIKQTNAAQQDALVKAEEKLSRQLIKVQSDMDSAQSELDQARAASPSSPAQISRLEALLNQYQKDYATLLSNYSDLRMAEPRSGNTVTIAESAVVPDAPIRPQILLATALAAMVGMLLAAAGAFFFEYINDTIKLPEDIENGLVLNTLGVITQFESARDGSEGTVVVASNPRSPIAEAYRALRTNLQFASVDGPIQMLLITSASPGEGKSTTAANLAAALAQAGRSVVLIDGDLRRPTVHRLLDLSNRIGLASIDSMEEARLDSVIQETAVENLRAVPSGGTPENPSELLESARVVKFLEDLKRRVDVIIVDAPPVLAVADAAIWAKRADAILLVVKSGATRREAARQAIKNLHRVGGNVVGVVLNRLSAQQNGYYQYDYYYTPQKENKKIWPVTWPVVVWPETWPRPSAKGLSTAAIVAVVALIALFGITFAFNGKAQGVTVPATAPTFVARPLNTNANSLPRTMQNTVTPVPLPVRVRIPLSAGAALTPPPTVLKYPKPQPISPADNANTNRAVVILDWRPVATTLSASETYLVEFWREGESTIDFSVRERPFRLDADADPTLKNGNYLWRVAVVQVQGEGIIAYLSDYGDTRRFIWSR